VSLLFLLSEASPPPPERVTALLLVSAASALLAGLTWFLSSRHPRAEGSARAGLVRLTMCLAGSTACMLIYAAITYRPAR
jgi:hypothetical protein